MGTYRQPSRVIDKSLNTLNQGMQDVNQVMVDGLKRIREEEIARAKEAKKQQEAKDKEFKKFNDNRNALVDGYKVKIDNWQPINQQIPEDWKKEDISINSQLKNNAMHYLDIMSESTEGDENYRMAKRAIENMIIQYPVMAQLLNDESKEVAGAYGADGALLSPNSVGALIETNDPKFNIKRSMLRDIGDEANPERFQVISGPSGISMIYTNDNDEEFKLNANAYQDYKSKGHDLLQTTNEKSYNTWMDATFKELGKDYDTHETTIKEFRDPSNKKIQRTEVINSYETANNKLKANIDAYVKNKNAITQNQWQLLGGPISVGDEKPDGGVYTEEDLKGGGRVYDPNNPDMVERASKLLYDAQLEKYGKQDKYKITEEEYEQSGRGSGSGSGTSSSDFSRLDENKRIIQEIVEVVEESKKQKEGLPQDALKVKAVDMYRKALGKIDTRTGSTYVTGAEISKEIANEIIKDREEEGKKLTDAEKDSLRKDILKDKMLTIYSKKGSGKWSEYPFDLENPRGMFEKLSLTIPGLTPKDIGDYGFTIGKVKSSGSTDPTKGMTEEEKIKYYSTI